MPQLKNKIILAVQEGRWRTNTALAPLSGLWSIGAFIKNGLYDRKMLPIHRLPACVVSVGGLVAGGSGKTPLVHLLAQNLSGSMAVLSSGYHARKSNLALGDELTMLAKRLPHVRMWADSDRVASGKKAIKAGARLLLLDDGFQYRRIFRDFELVILDGAHPFGFDAFLPRGLLRDPPSRLQEADAVFVNGLFPNELRQKLSSLTKAPLIGVELQIQRVLDQQGQTMDLKGCKVGAFCAIAQPQRFLQTLFKSEAQVVDHWFLPDHSSFDPTQLEMFAKKCQSKGAIALVCTEKDWVKLPPDFPSLYLEMKLQIISGADDWQNLLKKIALRINNYYR